MHSREAFDQLRAAAKRRERKDVRLLALVSVGLGLAQLVFIRWVEAHFTHQMAVAIEGGVFLVYAALVILLLWRLQRHKRAGAPRCPQCGRALQGLSERVAAATGRCDSCGGQVLAGTVQGFGRT